MSFLGRMTALFIEGYPLLIEGLTSTLLLAIFGTLFGLGIGLILITVQKLHVMDQEPFFKKTVKRFNAQLTKMYVAFFRGTPMLVQAMVFYYGLNQMGFRIGFYAAGLTVVSLNTAAYLTEVLKAGLNGLDVGQSEAALSLGMTHGQTYRLVLLPQALKNMVPAIGNELIVNIKDTAVLSVIGVGELFYMGRALASRTFLYTEAFVLVSIVYLMTVLVMVELLKRISRLSDKDASRLLNSQSEAGV
jgi:putative lysine transport system permease protein